MPDWFLGMLLSFTLNIPSRLECPPRKPDAFSVLLFSREHYKLYLTMYSPPRLLNVHPRFQARRLAIAADRQGNKLSAYIYKSLFFFIYSRGQTNDKGQMTKNQ